jgi:hypothetical protein
MKVAIILQNDTKQIVFTPENESEEQAINLLKVNKDNCEVRIMTGSVFGENMAGYIRQFKDTESVIILLQPKGEIK